MDAEDFLARCKADRADVIDVQRDIAGEVMRVNIFIPQMGCVSVPRWSILENDWDYFSRKLFLRGGQNGGMLEEKGGSENDALA